jgi:hypothetical protein
MKVQLMSPQRRGLLNALKQDPKAMFLAEPKSIGNGMWCLNITDKDNNEVCSYSGSNGTHSEADDLWNEYEVDLRIAELMLRRINSRVLVG